MRQPYTHGFRVFCFFREYFRDYFSSRILASTAVT